MNLLEAMHLFVKVAELGSFTAAANHLGVGRSVVSRQIAALEKHLGSKLIHRTTRSLSLTTVGRAYLEKCRHILYLVEESETQILAQDATPNGPIKISLPLSYGKKVLVPWLLEFSQLYPEIELTLHFSDSQLNLIEQGIDVSVRITDQLEPTTIVRRLNHCHMYTLASPDYLQAYGEPQAPDELEQHKCLGYSMRGNNQPWPFKVDEKIKHYYLTYSLQANNGDVLAMAAAQGHGVVILPEFIAQPYMQAGELVPVLTKYQQDPQGVYAVFPSNRYMPYRVSLLVDFIAAKFEPSHR